LGGFPQVQEGLFTTRFKLYTILFFAKKQEKSSTSDVRTVLQAEVWSNKLRTVIVSSFSPLPCRKEVADALIDRMAGPGINRPFDGEVDD
jgi:hypothetical protein